MTKHVPWMDIPGSDPSSAMKGDKAQFVHGSTAPGTKPKRPQKVGPRGFVGQSQYALPRKRKPPPGEP